jgi:hypothetical protein
MYVVEVRIETVDTDDLGFLAGEDRDALDRRQSIDAILCRTAVAYDDLLGLRRGGIGARGWIGWLGSRSVDSRKLESGTRDDC